MIRIINPNQFKTVTWKNGKGQTTELAISENGTLDNFDWRLSIASVVEDGPFSDFSGYERNLFLLEGEGIKLLHNEDQIDVLNKPLSVSSFNGQCKTIGKLINGPIIDFNLMTKEGIYQVKTNTFVEPIDNEFNVSELTFIYSHHSNIQLVFNSDNLEISKQHLVVISGDANVNIRAENMIVISLRKKAL